MRLFRFGVLLVLVLLSSSCVLPDYIGEHRLRKQLKEGLITQKEYEDELKKLDDAEPAAWRRINGPSGHYSRTF